MTYRVNYGNGQVSNDFATKKEAMYHRASLDFWQDCMFIQYYTDGEWFSCGGNNGQE